MKKDTATAPAKQTTQAPAAIHQPMLIEMGSIKITVHTEQQLDSTIASLKKNGVI